MAANEPSRLWFTARDDPRDGCIMIGFTRTANNAEKPVYFTFATGQLPTAETRTTISVNGGEAVAWLDWTMHGTQLGLVALRGTAKPSPMSYFVMKGSMVNARMFASLDGNRYEWRKLDEQGSYDLYSSPQTRIATFRREQLDTPVGRAWAIMQYTFDNDLLLLESLLALSLNRWIDWRGM